MQSMNTAIVRKILTVGALALACAALGACRSGPPKCAKPGVYAEAESIAPLRIPTGLQAPDTRGALRIPELTDTTPQPLPAGASCLEQPPRYAPNARLTKPEEDKKSRRRNRKEERAAPATTPAPASKPAP